MATKLESDNLASNGNAQSGMVAQSDELSEASPNATPTKSAEWSEHEHVSAQVQLEAEKLVDMVGNPELAKQAINAVEERKKLSSIEETQSASSMTNNRYASAKIANAFLNSLVDLETSLATPLVSGELLEWVGNTLRACESVRSFLLGDVQKIHKELFSNILKEDVDLSSQVEKLRTADVRIAHDDCDHLISRLRQLEEQARSVQQDEAQIAGAVANVAKRGVEFVMAARGQETAISAWLSEAFNRDTGSGD